MSEYNEIEYKNLIAFHPGSYLEEIIEELNMTQEEFAKRINLSTKTVSKIINGKANITPEVASSLPSVTGISAKTWLNLQDSYDLKIQEIESEKQLDQEKETLKAIDFNYFIKNNFIENKKYNITQKINTLRSLFHINSLTYLKVFNPTISYRKSQQTEKSIINSNILVELGMNQARNKANVKFDKSKLNELLPEIKKMPLQHPRAFYKDLEEKLHDCGIILVCMPSLRGSSMNGAVKKFKNGSIMLLLTDKNKNSDIFWFSLVHEIGHITNNEFYSSNTNKEDYQINEKAANAFASDFFIDHDDYQEFLSQRNFSKNAIIRFANKQEIPAGFVVGRLQYDGLIEFSQFNYLKSKYQVIND